MARVYLRSLDHEDLERTHKWHNDRELYESLAGTFRPVSRAAEAEWLNKAAAYSSSSASFAICVKDESRHIGNCYLRDINWTCRHAELHIFIGEPDDRSKGYGSEAVRLLLDHAFSDLGLNRVHLSVMADNAAAIRAYEKNGFAVEGTLRRHVFKRGAFKDVVVMGICADEFSR